jgi:hypothetical protein
MENEQLSKVLKCAVKEHGAEAPKFGYGRLTVCFIAFVSFLSAGL